MTLSERIVQSGLSDIQIAKIAGVCRTTAFRWRTDPSIRPDSPATAAGLARALGVHPSVIRPDWAEVMQG